MAVGEGEGKSVGASEGGTGSSATIGDDVAEEAAPELPPPPEHPVNPIITETARAVAFQGISGTYMKFILRAYQRADPAHNGGLTGPAGEREGNRPAPRIQNRLQPPESPRFFAEFQARRSRQYAPRDRYSIVILGAVAPPSKRSRAPCHSVLQQREGLPRWARPDSIEDARLPFQRVTEPLASLLPQCPVAMPGSTGDRQLQAPQPPRPRRHQRRTGRSGNERIALSRSTERGGTESISAQELEACS